MNIGKAALVVSLALFALPAAAACALTEKQVIGAWSHAGGEGFFEGMAFEVNEGVHEFNSWLHQRPEMLGARWTLNDCRLHINHRDDAAMSFNYIVSLNQRGQLLLRDVDDGTTARYKRIKP